MSIGRESQTAPDYGKAKTAAAQVFALLEKKPRIDNYSTEGLKPVSFSSLLASVIVRDVGVGRARQNESFTLTV